MIKKIETRKPLIYILSACAVASLAFFGGEFLSRLGPQNFSSSSYFPRQDQDFPSRSAVEASLAKSIKILESDPSDPEALTSAGIAYYALGREHAVEAINNLEAARQSGALDARIFYYLGKLYSMVGLPQFAAVEFDRFLRHQGQDKEVLLELGRLQFQQGNYAQSAMNYEKLLALSGKRRDPLVVENLGLASLKLKDWEKARSLFEEVRAKKSANSQESAYFLAEAHRELGHFEEALALYDEALRAPLDAAKQAPVLEGKILCYEKLESSNPEEVSDAAKELLKLEPKHAAARRVLARSKKKARS